MYQLCRHVRISGYRCRAAALHNKHFCYYHLTQRQSAENKRRQAKRLLELTTASPILKGNEANSMAKQKALPGQRLSEEQPFTS